MSFKPLFSILIANFNNGKYFKDCYDSIINQTYTNWEAIIVDDKSSDDSLEIIKGIIQSDARFKIFENEENGGCGFAKRKTAEYAIGEIAGFLDPDDALLPDAIELMINKHIEYPNACLVHSSLYFCDEKLNITSEYILAKKVVINNRFTNLDYAVTHFSTFKMQCYHKSNGINSNLSRAVDQDLYSKLSEHGDFVFFNMPLYKYRIHQAGIASQNGNKAFYAHLKVIADAEKRRGVNLENEISPYLNVQSAFLDETKFNNPRFLFFKMFSMLKNAPIRFFKRIFIKQ